MVTIYPQALEVNVYEVYVYVYTYYVNVNFSALARPSACELVPGERMRPVFFTPDGNIAEN